MKKIIFSISLSLTAFAINAQKTIIVNGGQFGNPSENVNVMIYDAQNGTSRVIDTIQTSSVQDILINGNIAYVAAQDSIVRYNLATETRTAAAKFAGASTKTMALAANNELIVSNWYGRSSNNIYIYNQTTLALLDSINIPSGVTSMLVDTTNDLLVVNQNQSTGMPNYQDTLGSIIAATITNRTVVTTLNVPNYTGDVGEFIAKPDGSGAYSFNSVSNTIIDVNSSNFPFVTTTVINTNNNLKVGNKSQFSVYNDTAFIRMNQGIGSFDLNTAAFIDTNIVDTVVTAFTYDTLNTTFFVTATDFFSYMSGKSYTRNGSYINTFSVGFSPEVIIMFYDQTTGLFDIAKEDSPSFKLYPNPASNNVTVEIENNNSNVVIYDANGIIVQELKMTQGFNSIDIITFKSGIYFVNVVSENGIQTQRLIVK